MVPFSLKEHGRFAFKSTFSGVTCVKPKKYTWVPVDQGLGCALVGPDCNIATLSCWTSGGLWVSRRDRPPAAGPCRGTLVFRGSFADL